MSADRVLSCFSYFRDASVALLQRLPSILAVAEIISEHLSRSLFDGSMKGLTKMLLRFFKSEDGNYSLIFAITLLPIMSAVAGVADYVGTTNGAAKLQQSLDATALAIATNTTQA